MNWTQIWLIITSVVTIASIITKLTPTAYDDNILAKITRVIALVPKPPAK